MRFEDYPIAFILGALFIICIITFGVGLAGNYNKDPSIIIQDQNTINLLNETLTDQTSTSSAWKDSFTTDNPQVSSGNLVVFSIWKIMSSIWTSIKLFVNLIFGWVQGLVGIPPMVTGTVTVILTIVLIFSIWRKMSGVE